MKNNKIFFEHIKSRNGVDDEALQQQNMLMTTILEKSPIGFAVNTMDDGKAIFITDKFEEIYGVEKDSIKGVENFFEQVYLDPVYREEMRKKTLEDIQSGDISRMKWDNIHITTKTGENKVISAMNIPVTEQNLMVSIVQDVTANAKLSDELKKSNEISESKLKEVEKMNQLMMNREVKMIEMKKQIEELEEKLKDK